MQRILLSSAAIAAAFFSTASACGLHARDVTSNNTRSTPAKSIVRTAIENIRVFDGCEFTLPRTVCLDIGSIVGLEHCDGAKTRINGTGKFLIPGLIDAHNHLSDVQSLENFTSYGATTGMLMNCNNLTQCDAIQNQKGLADIRRAGLSAVGNGSLHATQMPRSSDLLFFPNSTAQFAEDYVEWQFRNGSNFMKLVSEPHGPSLEQQLEMIQTAHEKYSAQVMTHATLVSSYVDAVSSLTDGIQHVPDDGLLNQTTMRRIITQDQFVTPTLNIFQYKFNDPALSGFFGKLSANESLAHSYENARLLYQAGVPLITGTDAIGNFGNVTMPFGLTLHWELQNFVDIIGMSPAEAINAATREAAKWHRLTDRGVIEVGRRADLVMLNSNPLVSISNTQDIARVWVEGVEVAQIAPMNSRPQSSYW